MSFLFGKKSKQQHANALPHAARDITSSHGREQPQPASLNGPPAAKEPIRPGPAPGPGPGSQPQTANSTPSGSVNNSLSSLQGREPQGAIAPEPKALRERAGSNEQVRNTWTLSLPPALPDLLILRNRAPCSRPPDLNLVRPKNPPTRGPLDASTSPPATPSHATAPPSTRSPPKMASSTSWEASLAAQQSRATSG